MGDRCRCGYTCRVGDGRRTGPYLTAKDEAGHELTLKVGRRSYGSLGERKVCSQLLGKVDSVKTDRAAKSCPCEVWGHEFTVKTASLVDCVIVFPARVSCSRTGRLLFSCSVKPDSL